MANAPAWLRQLAIGKVALVDEGANQDAHIVLFKRKEGDANGATAADTDKTTTAKGGESMTEQNKETPAGTEPENKPDDQKPEERLKALEEKVTELTKSVETATKEKETADAEVVKFKKLLAQATGVEVPETPVDIFKGVTDPETKAALEKINKEREDAQAEVKKLREEQAAEIEKRLDREKVDAITPVVNRLPVGKVEDFAKHLRTLEKADAKAEDRTKSLEEVERVLKAANELVQKGLLGQLGSGAGNIGGGGSDAESKLESLAKAKATEDGISEAEAYQKVLDTPEGSALYTESLQDHPSTHGKGA